MLIARTKSATGQLRIVDLCTGSGAIAAAIKSELPNAQVFAVELSEDAIPYTRKNLEPLGVHLVQGDALTALPDLAGTFDAVLSNPPYIPPANVPADPEAALHDPDMALYGGGEDGMQMPSAIAARRLRASYPPAACSSWSTTTPRKKPSPSCWRVLASRAATRCVT